ncbi:MAG: hypothetical protein ACRCVT_07810, partial [Leadbetterella sp.]
NISTVFVSHDSMDVIGYSDEILVLKEGRFIQKGKPDYIYKKPKNKYVAGITGEFFTLNLENNSHIYRPENLVIDSLGDLIFKVDYCVFKGPFYEIHGFIQDQVAILRHTNPFLQDTELKVSLESNFFD